MDKRANLKMQRALRATWWKKMAQSYGRETPEATGAIEMFGEPNLPHPEYTRGYADGVNDGWRDATAAQRERLCCCHPAACVEGGSSDPDAQVTMWCGACASEDQAREEATKAEREKWLQQVNGWMLELRSATKGIPVFDPVGHKLHLIKQDMLFELRAIKEADDDPR